MKAETGLAVSENTTFIQIMESAVSDASGNPIIEVAESNAKKVSEFTRDKNSPSLERFYLDLDNGELTLLFNETIFGTSIVSLNRRIDSPVQRDYGCTKYSFD